MQRTEAAVQENEQIAHNQRVVWEMISSQESTVQEVTAAPLFPVKAM